MINCEMMVTHPLKLAPVIVGGPGIGSGFLQHAASDSWFRTLAHRDRGSLSNPSPITTHPLKLAPVIVGGPGIGSGFLQHAASDSWFRTLAHRDRGSPSNTTLFKHPTKLLSLFTLVVCKDVKNQLKHLFE